MASHKSTKQRRQGSGWALGLTAGFLLACATAVFIVPIFAPAAPTPVGSAQATRPAPTPRPAPKTKPAPAPDPTTDPGSDSSGFGPSSAPTADEPQAQLASTLMQNISVYDQINAQLTDDQRQQATLQAQIGADQARVEQMNQQIKNLTAQLNSLTASEQRETTEVVETARYAYTGPPTLLYTVLEAGTLSSYVTQLLSPQYEEHQAALQAAQIDKSRRQVQKSRNGLDSKRNQASGDAKKKQSTQMQLQTEASQLESEQSMVASEWSQSMTEVATQSAGAQLTRAETQEMAPVGTQGLDAQTLSAGVAAGMYVMSNSQIQWPADPDPSPLGLANYPGYCQYTPVQCTCYAANAYQKYTGGTLPDDLGNGGQWYASAQADGIPTSQTPVEGAVVVFNGPGYSQYGHVALVRSVISTGGTPTGLIVWERNFDEQGSFDVRMVALGAGDQVAGYILPGN